MSVTCSQRADRHLGDTVEGGWGRAGCKIRFGTGDMNTQGLEIFFSLQDARGRSPFRDLPYYASQFQFAAIMAADNHLALKADCIGCAQVECAVRSSAVMKSASKLLFSVLKKYLMGRQEIVNSGSTFSSE